MELYTKGRCNPKGKPSSPWLDPLSANTSHGIHHSPKCNLLTAYMLMELEVVKIVNSVCESIPLNYYFLRYYEIGHLWELAHQGTVC